VEKQVGVGERREVMTDDEHEAQVRERVNNSPQQCTDTEAFLLRRLNEARAEIARDRADWLVDAVATATQNRMFLRGDEQEDHVATEAIRLNGEKAISVAIARALEAHAADTRRAALEEAVQVALAYQCKADVGDPQHSLGQGFAANLIAIKIRALIDRAPLTEKPE
jgi:hypothetical protein